MVKNNVSMNVVRVLEEWIRVCIVYLYKCKSGEEIMLIPRKVYGRVIIENSDGNH